MFFIGIWLALPFMLLTVFAIYFSLKASNREVLSLVIGLAAFCLAVAASATLVVLDTIAGAYVAAVVAIGVVRRRRRAIEDQTRSTP